MKVMLIAGARPNFMKIAPLVEELERTPGMEFLLVHTGQHYDEKMSDLFFRQLGIPEPDVNLEVGSASHAVQTAEIMRRFEPVVLEHKPDVVLVVGDVNSTVACGLVAVKLGVTLVHVEAGLRSRDRRMPEEINRIVTDSVSTLLFVSEPTGVTNLRQEGHPSEHIWLVGNLMIDTLARMLDKARRPDSARLDGNFVLVTLHRPWNVDDERRLREIVTALIRISKERAVVFLPEELHRGIRYASIVVIDFLWLPLAANIDRTMPIRPDRRGG